ncbi:MAG TPA: G1 family glutamic endopeptidase [Candidatus Paceibacterota bacterium]|nr:G1 family glutamic endopeptidase [Candidatus Paceibacterota bacterium]
MKSAVTLTAVVVAASFIAQALAWAPVFAASNGWRHGRAAAVPDGATPVAAPQAPLVATGLNTSLNWSGYMTDQGPFTAVAGSWVVPQVAPASSTTADATWVGIGGVSSDALIQAGTQALTDPSGAVDYQAWFETLPQDMKTIPLDVHAHDAVNVSITESDTNVWSVSFADATTGENYRTTVTYRDDGSSAEWIEEMPTANIGALPLDRFGSVSFTNGSATADGTALTIAETRAGGVAMMTPDGAALASPSPLGADGASFTVLRSNVVSAGRDTPSFVSRIPRTGGWRSAFGGNAPTVAVVPTSPFAAILDFLRAHFGLPF